MQIKTILNRIQKHRGFVYGTVQLEEQGTGLALTVDIAPHRRNRPRCAGCGDRGPVYDRLARRRFEFVRLWGRARLLPLHAATGRVRALRRDARTGTVGRRQALADDHLLVVPRALGQAPRSWQEVARVFRTSWDQVFRSVAMPVAWGRDHVDFTGIRAMVLTRSIGSTGAISSRSSVKSTRRARACSGSAHRRAKTLLHFFRWFGKELTGVLTFICSDMWRARATQPAGCPRPAASGVV